MFDEFKKIKNFVFDIDGVLTNAKLLITEEGELLRSVSVRDGLAIKMALERGYRVAIITGGKSDGVYKRFTALGVKDYYSGVHDKMPVFKAYIERHNLKLEETLYIGDDLPDLPVIHHAGLGCAPKDAINEVLETADYICNANGGEGCARELIEKVLKLNDNWLRA